MRYIIIKLLKNKEGIVKAAKKKKMTFYVQGILKQTSRRFLCGKLAGQESRSIYLKC